MSIFFKPKLKEEITQSVFMCKRDGLTIRGTEYRPQGENLPIAIVCHGFMAFQDTVRQYAILMAELGYVSYCFDFCGGSVIKGKSDGKTTDMSVLTEVKDLEAVIDYVRLLPYVNRDSIVLMGCSQGGFVSALVAAKNQYPVEKLCLLYPALCIPDDARAGKMMMAKFDPNNVPELLNCGPMKLGKCYPTAVMQMNPFDEIKPYFGHVCMIHGTKDKIVNPEYSKKAYEAYQSTTPEGMDKRVQIHFIENGVHGFSKKHDRIAFEYIKDFIKMEI